MVLNVVYALLVEGMDGKERQRVDDELYAGAAGWEHAQAQAMRRLDEIADEQQDGG